MKKKEKEAAPDIGGGRGRACAVSVSTSVLVSVCAMNGMEFGENGAKKKSTLVANLSTRSTWSTWSTNNSIKSIVNLVEAGALAEQASAEVCGSGSGNTRGLGL